MYLYVDEYESSEFATHIKKSLLNLLKSVKNLFCYSVKLVKISTDY